MSKEITGFKPGSKKWKKFMAYLYGMGGAVVIVGALFKLQHYPGSSIMLITGLGTEAIIFFFSSFEPMHNEPKWELIYPELAEDYDGDAINNDGNTVKKLDSMLEKAKIDPELIESLGKGMVKLSDNVSKMSEISDLGEVTDDFTENVKSATSNLAKLSHTYEEVAKSINDSMEVDGELIRLYTDNLKSMNENLSSLNNVYLSQLTNTKDYIEVSGNAQEGIKELLENLNSSVEHTRNYKENMAELSTNLSSLNKVYGNMLSAMNYNV